MSAELTFRKSRKEDLTRISEFRKNFFPDDSSIRSHEPEYYGWKCYQNPFQPGEMWLAEDGDMLVGIKSMIPKRMKISGEVVVGAETGDTFTHPDYQRRGIFTNLFKVARESGLDGRMGFIYGTPNENSLPGYVRKLAYKQIPIKLRNLIKPVNPKQLLKAKLRLSPLATVLSPIVEIASKAMFTIGTRGITKSNIFVHQELTFPTDIDALWQQASTNYEVILVRTKDYLEWRYVTNPDSYSILVAGDEGGGILGYMVIKTGFLYTNVPVGFIVDFFTLEHDPNIFKKLLVDAFKEFYQRKVNFVSTYTVKGSFYDRILVRAGFFPYNEVPLICYDNELVRQVSSKACKWHFTMGDTDNI